ncbi:MAG: zf-HC2 domain-containing protein [Acidobacteria bacterium]|nr:zf-HC2 domain-containing protein [Acidobacteriota bacterium]MCB9398626.1 zf-HC2 domain-containing protein [Acidobacteriota bacterium]
MTCESWSEMLPWILNGSASDEIRQSFRAHLSTCDVCRAELEECQWAWRVFQDHPPIEIITATAFGDRLPKDVQRWLQAHLETCPSCPTELQAAQTSAALLRKKPFPWRNFAALAATLLLGFAIGYWQKGPQTISAIQAIDLMPDAMRGTNTPIALDRNAQQILLILYPNNRPPYWQIEVFSGTKRLYQINQMAPLSDGSVSLLLPPPSQSEGWRIVLSAAGDQEEFNCEWRHPSQ